ncbi:MULTISPECIES: hypothetical protein [Mycolicibacterium]|jgi:hypothetical protein|uniref:Uncharacterized protein n=2 Tax=Mycolicibacterium TaxID=1866885 RepID=A0A378T8Q1_9MYCO|nr:MULTISPECIES: hypothetical protein [Mycolicibacterium]MCV7186013.1 hypothetical protein [Mycolicibacterium murale]BBY88468.1 hypothetical protein MTOK_42500 [Mycolicibacterium tokaiense]GFG60241.1 hypothetical protein MMUR_43770 [Mycolicibacterium murale]STZ57010.1 Uncharacterised protein [Mycolicibacterium tokaiense]
MTTAIVIGLVAFVGVALVVSQLVRMKDWLKKSPPLPPPIEFPDDEK